MICGDKMAFSFRPKYLTFLVGCLIFCCTLCSEFEMLHAAATLSSSSSSSSGASETAVNSDLVTKMSWKCANNASCLYAIANSVMNSYRRGDVVQFGIFDLIKLPPPVRSKNNISQSSSSGDDARGMKSGVVQFLSGNAIRIPIGPMVFSVQRAEDDGDYIEVALLKKAQNQARRHGDGRRRGDDDDDDGIGIGGLSGLGGGGGGLLGGGGGLGGGNGGGNGGGGLGHGGGNGGGGGGGRIRRHHQDKKQFQMFIPMYLAATTFGWTMVAAKAVGLLTLKALVISKLAFVVAAMVIVKKMMDNASEKMMYQFPEHSPYMMPYNMDYGMHPMGGGSEISTGDLYPSAMHMAAAGPLHPGHPGLESFAAESNLHHVTDVHNNTQMLAALNAAGLAHQGQKVKREDSWLLGKRRNYRVLRKPFRHETNSLRSHKNAKLKFPVTSYINGEAFALAAAAKVAEESAEIEDEMEEDDVF